MLEAVPEEHIQEIVLTVLLAHHMREVDRLQAIIDQGGQPDSKDSDWQQLLKVSASESDALVKLTHQIQANLEANCP